MKKPKELAVCERTPETLAESLEVGDLLIAESQTVSVIVGPHVRDMPR